MFAVRGTETRCRKLTKIVILLDLLTWLKTIWPKIWVKSKVPESCRFRRYRLSLSVWNPFIVMIFVTILSYHCFWSRKHFHQTNKTLFLFSHTFCIWCIFLSIKFIKCKRYQSVLKETKIVIFFPSFSTNAQEVFV
jgi:hypothetical protein